MYSYAGVACLLLWASLGMYLYIYHDVRQNYVENEKDMINYVFIYDCFITSLIIVRISDLCLLL